MKNVNFRMFHLLWMAIGFLTFVFVFFSAGLSAPFLFGAPLALWGGILSSLFFVAAAIAAAFSVRDIDDL